MKILQLSDLHLVYPGKKAFREADAYSDLKQTVDYLLASPLQADYLVVTGDVSNDGTAESYELALEQLKRLDLPMVLLPGNHDEKTVMQQVCGTDCHVELQSAASGVRVQEFDEATLVFADTAIPGKSSGKISSRALQDIQGILTKEQHKPVLLFMHHVPFKTGYRTMDEPFEGLEAFRETISGHKNAQICCGHIHTGMMTMVQGVPHITAPPVCMLMAMDYQPAVGNSFYTASPAFALHVVEEGTVVTHFNQVPHGETCGGPFFFVE